jgi:hypothetical protein
MSRITLSRLFDIEEFEVVPLKRKRVWMDRTPDAYAYQCMPLDIANEYGWAVLCPAPFTATWDGDPNNESIEIRYDDGNVYEFVDSQFGNGVLTVSVDFVVRTDPGVSLYIRGIPNTNYPNLQPLDAIVETDWLPFTFTYNYRFLAPGAVRFEQDQPMFCFFPIKRGEIEEYEIVSAPMSEDEEFTQRYEEYRDSRQVYLDDLKAHTEGEDVQIRNTNQRYYSNAKDPKGEKYSVQNHVKKVMLNKVTNDKEL